MKSFVRSHQELLWRIVAIGVLLGVPLAFADWDFLQKLDFGAVWKYRATLLSGLATTIAYTLGGIGVGYPLGLCLAILGRSKLIAIRAIVIAYVEFWRNTPLLVQLFWIHFALPLIIGGSLTTAQSGFIALTANIGAYYCEVARAGINSISSGQWDAARALGLRGVPTWRLIIFPQALRIIIPPSTNLILSIFKATSILSILGIGELMRETVRLSNFTFRVVEFYTATAFLYLIFGLVVAILSRRLEKHLDGGATRSGF